MKTMTKLFLPMAILLTGPITRAQDVSLGDVTFNAASADADATWYDPMQNDHAIVFEGFGTNAGRTRTLTYSPGGLVAGVQTIKRHMVEDAPNAATEDLWLAFDAADDARVLKIVRNGTVVFEAQVATTPPLYLPSHPTDGQTWDLAGATVTVEYVVASFSGGGLKVKTVAADGKSESSTITAGSGVVFTETGEDSGWRPKPAALPQ